jgi:non-specific serine/threonine protein kinase
VSAARPLIDRLVAVDPLTPLTHCMPAWADVLDGNFAAAIEPYRRMFEMDPGNPMARLFYVWVLQLNRRDDLIPPILESFPEEVRETVPARVAHFVAAALVANRRGGPLPAVTPGMEAAANETDVFARMLAGGYALAGLPDLALHWLEVAIDRGFINYPFLAELDPSLENLRREQRFSALMDVAHERWKRFEI